jgi:hypothetical protein
MKSKFTYLITMLFLMFITLGQLFAQDIIFVTDDNLDDPNVQFLENQGFNVTKVWYPKMLGAAGADTIAYLNSADLVIIGRSGGSTNFQQQADKDAWNGLTAPVLLVCPWKARNSRLNWFNSGTSNQINVSTGTTRGFAVVPGDEVFDDVTLEADNSLTWSFLADDYILVKQPSNGTWIVDRGDSIPLVVRFDPLVPFYDGAGDSAAGPRSYIGMGNDANGPANFFPLTREAKKIYLAEICRMIGISTPEIVYEPGDYRITFVTDDLLDDPNVNWLTAQGFKVEKVWYPLMLGAAGQDTIDMLNAADLVIIGRSGGSTNFQQQADKDAWNGLTSPQLLICPWKARNSRLNWFNSGTALQINVSTGTTEGFAVDPADEVFDDVDLVGDSLTWSWLADDYILVKQPSNGDWIVNRGDSIPLLVRFDPLVPFYDGAGDSAAGPRSYIGMGNDANGPSNFFPLTREAKKIYLAEICRLMDFPTPEITYTAIDFSVTMVTDDNFDQPCITFLQKNGFKVKTFWPPKMLGAAGQDTIDMLNAEDLVIIGRSGGSTNFQQQADKDAWNGLTSPLILNCPWKARNSRLNWFNSGTALQINVSEGTTTAMAVVPDDDIFEFAPGILNGDSIPQWSFLADDYILVKQPSNGDWIVDRGDSIPLVVRFEPLVPFYDGAGDSAAGDRTYFGMGNDAQGPSNFFPLTKTGQAIYFAEALRLVGAPAYAPVYLDEDRSLSALEVVGGTLVPAFNKDSLHYTVAVGGTIDSVQVTATATSALAVVTGTGWKKTPNVSNNITVVCTAENARPLNYVITVTKGTGIEDYATTTNSSCSIYPNPVNDKLVISATDAINSITIYNLQGATVFSRKVNGRTVELSLSELNAGIYFVKVQSGKDVFVSKITKN